MRKGSAGLRIVIRPDTGALTIVGTVAGVRVRRRTQSNDRRLALEEAAALETEILRTAWHGERRGTRTFAEAVNEYLAAAPRTKNTKYRLNRLLKALGRDMTLGQINQETVNRLKVKLLATRRTASDREAQHRHAAARGALVCEAARLVRCADVRAAEGHR